MIISEVKVGNPILLMEYGEKVEGIVSRIDMASEQIEYETAAGVGVLPLNPAPERGGGAFYEVAKHSSSNLIVAYHKGWQSDKYVKY